MTQTDALKLALEALEMADELCKGHGVDFKEYGLEFDRDIQVKYKDAITAIKEALAQPEQEPVVHSDGFWCADLTCKKCYSADFRFKHTTPPQRTWVGLTDEEIEDCYKQGGIGRAIQMLKEKNT
jgi:hypothetical protein